MFGSVEFRLDRRDDTLGIDLAAHLAERVLRDANPTGFGNAFEPGGDVDAVAVDVGVLDDHIAEVHADPESDPLFFRCRGIPLDHRPLYGQRAGNRFDHAHELDQQAIAGRLDDPAVVLCDHRIDQLATVGFKARECPFLALARLPRIARDIGRQYRHQPALDAFPRHHSAPRSEGTAYSVGTDGEAMPQTPSTPPSWHQSRRVSSAAAAKSGGRREHKANSRLFPGYRFRSRFRWAQIPGLERSVCFIRY
jgi:hypothetical protein